MREYAIFDINNLINTWLFNHCQSYKITTSKKIMLTKCQSLTRFSSCGFLKTIFAYLSSETTNKGYVNDKDKNK